MTISISAILQIALLYWVIYAILKAAKGSRFGQVLLGVGLIAVLMTAFTLVFNFDVLTRIVQFLLAYMAISSVVIFQPEIRRILSTVGALGFFDRPKYHPDGAITGEFAAEIILKLSESRTGALIAFERGISLKGYENSGVPLDAIFTRELMFSIFTPPMPLHDGGVIIRNARIAAAHAIFPVSNNPNLISSGMRHRAAVGLSEETDALVIAISEESGDVSVAHNGKLFRYSGAEARPNVMRWVCKTIDRKNSARMPLTMLTDAVMRRLQAISKTKDKSRESAK